MGVASGDRFPTVVLRGDAKARGLAYGEACAPLIRRSLQYYLETVFRPRGCSDALLQDYAAQCAEVVGRFSPESLIELKAIAQGCDVPLWHILAVNARTEILNVAAQVAAPECTAFYMKERSILAQNWDWIRIGLACCVVLDIETENGGRMAILTEAGMLGKIGLNHHGLGVCLNILQARHARIGVPVAVLARVVLDAASASDARRLLRSAGTGRATHFLVGDRNGDCISVEYAGDEFHELQPQNGVLVHTNHVVGLQSAMEQTEALAGSFARFDRATILCTRPGAATVEQAKAILADQSDELSALNVPWRASRFMPGEDISTCAAIVMDLQACAMHVRKGFDPRLPWTTYHP